MLTGVSANEYHGHTGGGSNVLCINLNISYTEGKYVDGIQGNSYLFIELSLKMFNFVLRLSFSCNGITKYSTKLYPVCLQIGGIEIGLQCQHYWHLQIEDNRMTE